MRGGFYQEAMAWRDLAAAGHRPAILRRCRSCTGRPASAASTSGRSTGCPATRVPPPSGSATPPPASSSSTCTARSCPALDESVQPDDPESRAGVGPATCPAWSSWRRDGASRTTASGRSAARAATSPTRRSWPGWPSTGPSRTVEEYGTEGPVERWRAIRQEIHDQVCDRGLQRRARDASPSTTARTSSTPVCS